MPWRTARLSKKGCGFATPECRAQRDVAVHPRPAPPPPLLAAPRPSTTALGYREIRWVVRSGNDRILTTLPGSPPSSDRSERVVRSAFSTQGKPPGFAGVAEAV